MNEIISWVKTIVFAVAVSLIILNFVIVNAFVPSGSMENTILQQDRVMCSRLSYAFSDPKRFDIAVFKYPDDEKTLFVKRIIGLPGEKINIVEGKVFVNGSKDPLPDYFCAQAPQGTFGPYTVPEKSYFMLGDNRNNSMDSRYWVSTNYVKKEKILGKAIFVYWDKSRPTFKLLTKEIDLNAKNNYK